MGYWSGPSNGRGSRPAAPATPKYPRACDRTIGLFNLIPVALVLGLAVHSAFLLALPVLFVLWTSTARTIDGPGATPRRA